MELANSNAAVAAQRSAELAGRRWQLWRSASNSRPAKPGGLLARRTRFRSAAVPSDRRLRRGVLGEIPQPPPSHLSVRRWDPLVGARQLRDAEAPLAINEKGTRSGSLSLQSRSCSADYAWGAFFVAFQAALQDFLKSWRAFRSLGNSSLAASLQGVPAAACEPPWP